MTMTTKTDDELLAMLFLFGGGLGFRHFLFFLLDFISTAYIAFPASMSTCPK